MIVDVLVDFSFGLWCEGCVVQVSFPFNFKRGAFYGEHVVHSGGVYLKSFLENELSSCYGQSCACLVF